MARPTFSLSLGIDYSGARTPTKGLRGLRVYRADHASSEPPVEVFPPPSPRKYWTRRGVTEWLLEQLASGPPALIGIDHGFSFPLAYFKKHGLSHDWPAFLDDFQRHWPTDGDDVRVDFVRRGRVGNGAARGGDTRWKRLCEKRAAAGRSAVPKSVFHFDVPGQVAKSTHAGLPWLRFLRVRLDKRAHFWPFDGWVVPAGRSVIAEVYPSLWNRTWPCADRTLDQHDAWCVAHALRDADRDGTLAEWFAPKLTREERELADFEGWILGVS